MKLIIRIIVLLAVVAAAGSAVADNVTASPQSPIDIDQALEIAFKNNPDLRVATDSVNKAKGMVDEAGARFNPSFSAQVAQMQQGPVVALPASSMTGNRPVSIRPASQTSANLQFVLPLDIFGRLRYASDIAKDQFSINYLSLLRTSQQLISQVKKSYYEQLRASGQRDAARAAVDVAEVRLKNTQARFEAGTVPKFDLTTAQVDLANLNQNLSAAQARVNIARAGLNRVLGLPADAPTEVVKSQVAVDVTGVDVAEASKTAIKQRPEIKMQQTVIALNKTNIALQRTAVKPSLGLVGNLDYATTQSFGASSSSWNAIASLNIPIWDGGVAKAKVDQAFADVDSAEDTLAQTELGITQEVTSTISVLEEAAKRTQTTAQSVALAEEALRLANVRYEAGIAVLVEVTNAESQLTQARFNEVNALYDYAIALADLQRATASQPEIEKLKLIDYKPMLNLDAQKGSPEDRK